MSKFDELYNKIITEAVVNSIPAGEARWRSIQSLIPEFDKYRGFQIGRSRFVDSGDSSCQCGGGGAIDFGELVVYWKNPNNKKDTYALCPKHFCEQYGVDYNTLISKYLESASWDSVAIPPDWKIKRYSAYNSHSYKNRNSSRGDILPPDRKNKAVASCESPVDKSWWPHIQEKIDKAELGTN